jgi:hypothetical protein
MAHPVSQIVFHADTTPAMYRISQLAIEIVHDHPTGSVEQRVIEEGQDTVTLYVVVKSDLIFDCIVELRTALVKEGLL